MPRLAAFPTFAGGAALAGLAGAASARVGWPFLAVFVVLPLVWRYPLPALLMTFLLFEEVDPESSLARNSPYLVSFGHQFYTLRIGPFSPALWLVFLAAAVSLYRFQHRLNPAMWRALTVCFAYFGLFALACAYWQVPLAQIVPMLAPQAALVAAALVGVLALSDEAQRRAATGCVAVALAVKLVFALAILIESPIGRGGELQISFYDTAFPTAAAAVLFGIAFRGKGRYRNLYIAVTLLIVVLSMRRSLWLACVLFCVVIALLNAKVRARLRAPSIAGVVVAVLAWIFVPGYVQPFMTRFTSGVAAALGGAEDDSAAGHIVDLVVGFDAASNAPWSGVGPYAQSIPGMVVQEAFYVHNELLQAWLRFGALGLTAVVVFTAWSCLVALQTLKRQAGAAATAGAVMLMLTPLNAITAPFLTTSARWPVFCGIAVGYLMWTAASDRNGEGILPEPAPRGVELSEVTGRQHRHDKRRPDRIHETMRPGL